MANGVAGDSGSKKKKYQLRRLKQFKSQESVLRTMYLESKGFQTIFSYGMACIHTFILIQGLVYFVDRELLRQDMEFMHWSFIQSFPAFAYSWSQLFILTSLVHPLERVTSSGFLPLPLYVLILMGYFVVTTYLTVTTTNLSSALFAAIASEHLRFMMKVLAYVISKSKQHSDPKDTPAAVVTSNNNGPSAIKTPFTHFVYFLFAPTNVYRESYPRTGRTDWKRVAMLSYFFLLQIFVLVISVRHWILPIFRDVGLRPLDLKTLISFQATAYALSFVFHQCGMGVALIHCWMNIFAEVLRFGDRNFYQDWWTSTNPLDRLRKWNSVVGDWIYEYVYSFFVSVTRGNKLLSSILIFMLSAALHDYVINLMFGLQFVPFITFTYGVLFSAVFLGMIVYKKLKLDQLFGGYILSNTMDHFATGLAWIIWINFYGVEFYCRKNVPLNETHAVIPRAGSCFAVEYN